MSEAENEDGGSVNRRRILAALAAAGVGGVGLSVIVSDQAQGQVVPDLEISDTLVETEDGQLTAFELREITLGVEWQDFDTGSNMAEWELTAEYDGNTHTIFQDTTDPLPGGQDGGHEIEPNDIDLLSSFNASDFAVQQPGTTEDFPITFELCVTVTGKGGEEISITGCDDNEATLTIEYLHPSEVAEVIVGGEGDLWASD